MVRLKDSDPDDRMMLALAFDATTICVATVAVSAEVSESEIVTEKLEVPSVLGEPLSCPLLKTKPAGTAPEVIL